MMNVLDINKLSVDSNGAQLLHDINLTLKAGEILAVVGANGAGKTTLLNSISGDVIFTQGAMTLCGKKHSDWSLQQRAKHLALLPQFSLLNFPYTVEEVVGLGRIPHRTGMDIDEQIIRDAMIKMDVIHLAHRPYTQLSGGEKQRTQLARVMTQIWREADAQPRLLLLDEPSTGLDLGHQQQLMNAVVTFAKQGVGILMVVHDINIAAKYADNIIALDDGHIAAYGTTDTVISAPLLKQLFGAHVCISTHPETKKTVVLA